MGVDLLLIPFESHDDLKGINAGISYSSLEVVRSRDMWDEILALESQAVPERFLTPFGDVYPDEPNYWNRETSVDVYDKPLRWVFAGDLASLRNYQNIPKESRNRAVWAYLEQLPPSTRVALFWY